MSISVRSTPLVCTGETRPITHLHFSALLPSNSPIPAYFLLSSCKDGKPILRDYLGDWVGTFQGHKGAVWSGRLSADGTRAATGGADFVAKVWDETGACLTTLPHQHIVRTVDLSSSASHLITGGNEKRLRIWDLSYAHSISSASTEGVVEMRSSSDEGLAHAGTIRSAFWDNHRNDTVISMAEDRTVKWFDLRTMRESHSITFASPITSMEKSHDGELASITVGNEVIFLNLETRQPYVTHQLPYTPSTASLHPIHRNTFVTGSISDGWVRVHDTDTGEEKEVGKGHHGSIHCVSYSPDGELYASGSEDGTVRLWQTAPKDYGLWRYNSGSNTPVRETSYI